MKKAILGNEISFGHAKVLAGIESFESQDKLCKACISGDLSVRELETLLKEKPKPRARRREIDAELKAFEHALKQKLGMKASLQGTQSRGKIILSYSSKDELNSLYSIIENIR